MHSINHAIIHSLTIKAGVHSITESIVPSSIHSIMKWMIQSVIHSTLQLTRTPVMGHRQHTDASGHRRDTDGTPPGHQGVGNSLVFLRKTKYCLNFVFLVTTVRLYVDKHIQNNESYSQASFTHITKPNNTFSQCAQHLRHFFSSMTYLCRRCIFYL